MKALAVLPVIATICGVLSLLLATWSMLFSLVDPVAPIYAYIAIPLALVSCKAYQGKLLVKVFAVLFVLAHCVAFWTVNDIQDQAAGSYPGTDSGFFNEDVFIQCSNVLFATEKNNQQQLSTEQQTEFDLCLKSGE